MQNLLVTRIIKDRFQQLSNKQGVKLIDFLDTLSEQMVTEMKRTGRKPL